MDSSAGLEVRGAQISSAVNPAVNDGRDNTKSKKNLRPAGHRYGNMGRDKKVPNSRRYEKEVKRPKTADRFEDLGYLPAEQLPTPREALGGGGAGIEGKN